MPKVIIRSEGNTGEIEFPGDARIILDEEEDKLTFYPNSSAAGRLLQRDKGARVSFAVSDSTGNLFRWVLGDPQKPQTRKLDVPVAKISFSDHLPKLNVVSAGAIIAEDAPKYKRAPLRLKL